MTAVGINGLGRIGRLLARRLHEREDASGELGRGRDDFERTRKVRGAGMT